MYGSPLEKRWPDTGKLRPDPGAIHNLADFFLPGKILLNATRDKSLTLPASDPPSVGEDSGGRAEVEGTHISRSPDADGLMTRARAAATGAAAPAGGGNALPDFRAEH
jgi:hypothetical protein